MKRYEAKINIHADRSVIAVYKLANFVQVGVRLGIDYSAPLLWGHDGSRAAPILHAPIQFPIGFTKLKITLISLMKR
jgi:hypothetical protein